MSRPASLDVVEDTVRREFDAQERRADAADTRAGLILGFAGLVVSLGGDGWPPLALAAQALAGLAALSSLAALSVRRFHGLDVGALRRYLRRPEVHAARAPQSKARRSRHSRPPAPREIGVLAPRVPSAHGGACPLHRRRYRRGDDVTRRC